MRVPEIVIDWALSEWAERVRAAHEAIDRIETDGWRYFEAHGSMPMREVTAKRLASKREIIAQAEYLAAYSVIKRA